MCEQSESDVITQLNAENRKLTEDFNFERNLNNVLENIRNNSLVLIQNCECIANKTTINVIKHLNTIYTDLKTKQNISKLNQINSELIIETIKTNQIENNLVSSRPQKPKSGPTSCASVSPKRKKVIGKSLLRLKSAQNTNKRIKTIEIKDNLQSEYSLVTQMFGIKDKFAKTVDNSDTEELSDKEYEVIECKPNVNSLIDPESPSSPGPSLCINESLSTSEELTNHSIDPGEEEEEEDILREHYCNICDQTFDEKIRLQNHLSKKHRIKSFECNICPYKTISIYHLKRHQTSHTTEKPFQCTIDDCGKWFKTKEHLYEHKNLKHSNYTPFECDICNYKTSRKASFNYHKSLHSRLHINNPFRCSIIGCNKSYTKRTYLESHISQCH